MQPTQPSNGAGCFDGPYLTPVVRDGAIQRWRGQWDGYSRDFFFGRDSRPPGECAIACKRLPRGRYLARTARLGRGFRNYKKTQRSRAGVSPINL